MPWIARTLMGVQVIPASAATTALIREPATGRNVRGFYQKTFVNCPERREGKKISHRERIVAADGVPGAAGAASIGRSSDNRNEGSKGEKGGEAGEHL